MDAGDKITTGAAGEWATRHPHANAIELSGARG